MGYRISLAAAISTAMAIVAMVAVGYASAGCTNCADHKYWPKIDGVFKQQKGTES